MISHNQPVTARLELQFLVTGPDFFSDDSSQSHFYKISKYLFHKNSSLAHKKMSFFASAMTKLGAYFPFWVCLPHDTVAIGKVLAASAQSFTLRQQATTEFTCRDHSIIACSRHVSGVQRRRRTGRRSRASKAGGMQKMKLQKFKCCN